MAENWDVIVEKEAAVLRKMSDEAAFAYIVETYPPGDPLTWGRALHLVKRRPWRKAFHRPLIDLYLRGIDHNGFHFAAEAFLTFIGLEKLSRVLWEETADRPDKRTFATLALTGAVDRVYGRDCDALSSWRRLAASADAIR